MHTRGSLCFGPGHCDAVLHDEIRNNESQMKTAGGGMRRSRLTPEEVAPIGAYGARATWPTGFQLYHAAPWPTVSSSFSTGT